MPIEEGRQSRCPICTGERLPPDASKATKTGGTFVLQGEIRAVAHPPHGFTPYGDYATASLYTKKSPVKYLKFCTSQDMDRSGLKASDKVQIEGCLHVVDGKELVFDIREVVIDPAN